MNYTIEKYNRLKNQFYKSSEIRLSEISKKYLEKNSTNMEFLISKLNFKADINDLVLNLTDSKGKEKLMKLSFSIKSSEPTIADVVESYKPEIIDVVISQIGARSSDELLTVTGKNLLIDDLVNDINGVLNNIPPTDVDKKVAKDSVKTILFTTLVIK